MDKDLFSGLLKGINNNNANWLDEKQQLAIFADSQKPLMIVAGAGTGKTTVLALRVLKFIFVDKIAPEKIICTTFTRKAARELRSRIIIWGQELKKLCRNEYPELIAFLDSLNISNIKCKTLDALIAELLLKYKGSHEVIPRTIKGSEVDAVFRNLVDKEDLYSDEDYEDALLNLCRNNKDYRIHFSGKVSFLRSLKDRMLHNGLSLDDFSKGMLKLKLSETDCLKISNVIRLYLKDCEANNAMDFSQKEHLFLTKIINNKLLDLTGNIDAILVDEYQDSNYLQEKIYLSLFKKSKCSLTVIGDDDQSIYRFRGSNVEIFSDFKKRIIKYCGKRVRPQKLCLKYNYRSNRSIIFFINHYVSKDPYYAKTRIKNKLPIHSIGSSLINDLPVLGVFGSSPQELAQSINDLLMQLINGKALEIITKNKTYIIDQSNSLNWNDAVLLAHSVKEVSYSGKERLPKLLADILKKEGVNTYNPRGKNLSDEDDLTEGMSEALPPNHFPMMTIHQAKGLEFPIVIVDIGSEGRTNRCFPARGNKEHWMEDFFNVVSGTRKSRRRAQDRAFDDLKRLYYVAYSRASSILILAGISDHINKSKKIFSVSAGDMQNKSCLINYVPQTQWRKKFEHKNNILLINTNPI